jgi:hypothetical protein
MQLKDSQILIHGSGGCNPGGKEPAGGSGGSLKTG